MSDALAVDLDDTPPQVPPHATPEERLPLFLDAFYARGLPFADACTAAGLRRKFVRNALRDPAFRKKWAGEMDVMRAIERASSIRTLAHLRDTAESSRVRLEAAKALLPEGDASTRVDVTVGVQVAGYVFDLSGTQRGTEPAAVAHSPVITTDYAVASVPDMGTDVGPAE